MQGITHLTIGMVGGLILAGSISGNAEVALVLAAAGLVGGLLPDIDHPQSTISQKLPILRLLTFWIPHRTLTHSLWIVLALGAATYLTQNPAVFAFALGYGLHIVADMMTRKGVPLFYPLSRNSLHLLPGVLAFQTGGIRELVLAMAIFGYGCWLIAQWF